MYMSIYMNNNNNINNINKVVFIGKYSTGKTCIINRIVNKSFDGTMVTATVGSAYHAIKWNERSLSIWDTGGSEKFNSLINIYLRNSKVIVFVFDLTDKSSLKTIEELWFKYYDYFNDCLFCLVGNKSDLYHEDHEIEETLNKSRAQQIRRPV